MPDVEPKTLILTADAKTLAAHILECVGGDAEEIEAAAQRVRAAVELTELVDSLALYDAEREKLTLPCGNSELDPDTEAALRRAIMPAAGKVLEGQDVALIQALIDAAKPPCVKCGGIIEPITRIIR